MKIRIARKILKSNLKGDFKKYSSVQYLKAYRCCRKRKKCIRPFFNWTLFREKLRLQRGKRQEQLPTMFLYGVPVFDPNKVYVLSPHGYFDEYILNADRDLVDSMAMRTEIAIQKQEAVK